MSKHLPTIALDTRGMEPGFKAHFGRGTGRYVTALTKELKKIPLEDLRLNYLNNKDLKLKNYQEKILSISPLGKTTLECQYFFPKNIKSLKPDFIHFFSHGDAPAFPQIPQIVSILDLIPLRFPQLYKSSSGGIRFHFARFLENRAALASEGIIAISHATKRDIVSILKIPEEKIFVTPLGVDESFFTLPLSLEAREKISLDTRIKFKISSKAKILLYIGGIDPRKNLNFLLEVLNEIREKTSEKEVILAIAGPIKKDKHYPEFNQLLSKLNLKDRVIELGFLSDEDLSSIMIAADLFVFPSLYEGFGLPILEAFSTGLNVIAGQNSSIPEVIGKEGQMLPDLDKAAWVTAIINTLNLRLDDNKKMELINSRIKHARDFTWAKTAKLTLEAYRHLIKAKL